MSINLHTIMLDAILYRDGLAWLQTMRPGRRLQIDFLGPLDLPSLRDFCSREQIPLLSFPRQSTTNLHLTQPPCQPASAPAFSS